MKQGQRKESLVKGHRGICPHCHAWNLARFSEWRGKVVVRVFKKCDHLRKVTPIRKRTGLWLFSWFEKYVCQSGLPATKSFRTVKNWSTKIERKTLTEKAARRFKAKSPKSEDIMIRNDRALIESFLKKTEKDQRRAMAVRSDFVGRMGIKKGNAEFARWGTRNSKNARTVRLAGQYRKASHFAH